MSPCGQRLATPEGSVVHHAAGKSDRRTLRRNRELHRDDDVSVNAIACDCDGAGVGVGREAGRIGLHRDASADSGGGEPGSAAGRCSGDARDGQRALAGIRHGHIA